MVIIGCQNLVSSSFVLSHLLDLSVAGQDGNLGENLWLLCLISGEPINTEEKKSI